MIWSGKGEGGGRVACRWAERARKKKKGASAQNTAGGGCYRAGGIGGILV